LLLNWPTEENGKNQDKNNLKKNSLSEWEYNTISINGETLSTKNSEIIICPKSSKATQRLGWIINLSNDWYNKISTQKSNYLL